MSSKRAHFYASFGLAALIGCERSSSITHESAPSSSSAGAFVTSSATSVAPAVSATSARISEEFRAPLAVHRRGEDAKALHYAALSRAQCQAELTARKLPVTPARGKTAGIDTPLRLAGPLRGVRFEMPKSAYGFVDCRLVLLLDDLAKELSASGVDAVIVNNTYRPGSTVAKNARSPAHPSQHGRGLAIDITELRCGDGLALNVEHDWHGARGAPPCGPGSRVEPATPAGVKLRNLACAIARGAYCNHLITPNRDEAHFNHLHCDIESGASELMVD